MKNCFKDWSQSTFAIACMRKYQKSHELTHFLKIYPVLYFFSVQQGEYEKKQVTRLDALKGKNYVTKFIALYIQKINIKIVV